MGKELRCDDCETDTRVDTAAIRALGIRSMVVTPIKEENRVIGVLAVFAPTPSASVRTAVTMNPGERLIWRREKRRSCINVRIFNYSPGSSTMFVCTSLTNAKLAKSLQTKEGLACIFTCTVHP